MVTCPAALGVWLANAGAAGMDFDGAADIFDFAAAGAAGMSDVAGTCGGALIDVDAADVSLATSATETAAGTDATSCDAADCTGDATTSDAAD